MDGGDVHVGRCAQLYLVALANGLSETWTARQPMLTVTYLFQYVPTFARLGNYVVREWLLTQLRKGYALD